MAYLGNIVHGWMTELKPCKRVSKVLKTCVKDVLIMLLIMLTALFSKICPHCAHHHKLF